MPDLRFTVENAKLKKILRQLAGSIAARLPTGWGFTLLLFEYGEKGSLFYISNAQRADMVRTMKEFIARNEWQTEPDSPPQ